MPTFFFQSSSPFVLTQIRASSLPSSAVRKMRSPQTAGVEPAQPGVLNFQTTFFDSSHSVGRFFSLLMPLLSGPRHCGQLSARTTTPNARITMDAMRNERADWQRVTAEVPRKQVVKE